MSTRPILRLTISIVVFDTSKIVLKKTFTSVLNAIAGLGSFEKKVITKIVVVNNGCHSGVCSDIISDVVEDNTLSVVLIEGQGNVGYGRGHNLTLERDTSDYFLVLNPDVCLDINSLKFGLSYLESNLDVVAASPRAENPKGKRQYLCRRYPTIFDLALRGFASEYFKKLFAERLSYFEMRDLDEFSPTNSIPLIGGCFMFTRTEAMRSIGGFDPSYFLYFEDYDLSLRIGRLGQISYLPIMKIIHSGGGASKKGWRHVLFYCTSAIRFYFKFGPSFFSYRGN